MKRKERIRRLRVGVGLVTAQTGWRNSALVVSAYRGGKEKREVVIEIGCPWEVRHLQRQLEKIMEYWREQVKP